MSFRGRGYGFLGESEALLYTTKYVYTMAAANVRKDYPASIVLHKKLGIEEHAESLSRNVKPIFIIVKHVEG